MSYNETYRVTAADKAAFRELENAEAPQVIRQLQLYRTQLGLYTVKLGSGKPVAPDQLLSQLDHLPPLLEEKKLHDLADHCVSEIAYLRKIIDRYPNLQSSQLTKIGFHLRNAAEQLIGTYSGAGGTPMGNSDAVTGLHTPEELLAMEEARELVTSARAPQFRETAWARISPVERKVLQELLTSKVQSFLKQLSERELADVFFHALDDSQPLPPSIAKQMGAALGNQAVRDTIVASVNGPTTLLEAVPQALAAIVKGEPLFKVEHDPAVIAERIAVIQQERAHTPRLSGPSMGSR